jgi:hypothetical protein
MHFLIRPEESLIRKFHAEFSKEDRKEKRMCRNSRGSEVLKEAREAESACGFVEGFVEEDGVC